MKKFSILFAAVLLGILFFSKQAFALTFSPTVIELEIEPGGRAEKNIRLYNETGSKLNINSEIKIVKQSEDGTMLFENYIADNVALTIGSGISLESGAWADIPFEIIASGAANPGTYSFAVLFSQVTGGDKQMIVINQKTGPIVLVNVSGNVVEDGGILSYAISDDSNIFGNIFDSAPKSFEVVVKNLGNVYFVPSGQILIENSFGQTVSSLDINKDASRVLPGWKKTFEVGLNSNKKLNGFLREWSSLQTGRYVAKLNLRLFDGKEFNQEIVYWAIPWRTLVIAFVVLILVVVSIKARRHRQI